MAASSSQRSARKPRRGKNSPFDQHKKATLSALDAPDETDRSLKGSLDAPIVGLIETLNQHPDYVTTSSCSGRIVLFEQVSGGGAAAVPDAEEGGEQRTKAGAGGWLLCEHAKVSPVTVEEALATASYFRRSAEESAASSSTESGEKEKLVWLRHEPFILHVQCRDVDSAQALYQLAREAGYREAGISAGKRKVMVGIRTTSLCLVAPVAADGEICVSASHLGMLVKICCDFFDQNLLMVQKFESKLAALLSSKKEEEEGKHKPEEDGQAASSSSSSMV